MTVVAIFVAVALVVGFWIKGRKRCPFCDKQYGTTAAAWRHAWRAHAS